MVSFRPAPTTSCHVLIGSRSKGLQYTAIAVLSAAFASGPDLSLAWKKIYLWARPRRLGTSFSSDRRA